MGYCKHESKLALRSAEIQPAHCSICSVRTRMGPSPPFFSTKAARGGALQRARGRGAPGESPNRIGTRQRRRAAPKGKLGISGCLREKVFFFTKAAAGGPCAPANKGGAQGKVGHLGVFEKKKKQKQIHKGSGWGPLRARQQGRRPRQKLIAKRPTLPCDLCVHLPLKAFRE